MSVINNPFICNMNFVGHENEFDHLISIKCDQNPIYYFYGSEGIGKSFFTQEFSEFYLKKNNYYPIYFYYHIDRFYFNCFSELMLSEKFCYSYINKIKQYIDDDSYENDFIDFSWIETKSGFNEYLNEVSPIFFKDFMNIEGKRGFLIVIENPADDIINSNFTEKFQKIYNRFNAVIPITFIITSEWDAMIEFKDKSIFENIIYNEIKPLANNTVYTYLKNTFEEMGCLVDEEIIDKITYLSNGHPAIMCQLGLACYEYVWKDNDYTIKNNFYWRNIRKENFYSGLFKYTISTSRIDNYFASQKNRRTLTNFLPILNKLFLEFKLSYDGSFYFSSKEFFNKLSGYEKSVYEDCLSYLIKNHVASSFNLEKNIYRIDNLMFLINSKIIWEYYLEIDFI